MKISIIFHSVCGNTYLMAKAYAEGLKTGDSAVDLLRVSDPSWAPKPDVPESAQKVLSEMMSLPQATPNDLLTSDVIILGSPTYFGNVTAQMKMFMDQTGGLWFHGKLIGKKCVAFASAGNSEGGGDLCLQAIHTYAKYMGLLSIPVPVTLVKGEGWPALGIIQYSSGAYGQALDVRVERAIRSHCEFILKVNKG